jgi:putative restriction endonuclease
MDAGDVSRELRKKVRELNVDRSGGARKPHKPLLLLYAIARLVEDGQRSLPFEPTERDVGRLLERFAPPVKGRVRPEYPWWRMRNDGVWELSQAAGIPTNESGDPPRGRLLETTGSLPRRFADALIRDPALARRVVQQILDEHFEPTLHEAVREAVGLDRRADVESDEASLVREASDLERELVERIRRPPAFRRKVLAAYEGRCVVTGFQVEIAGTSCGVEAAHLQWHSKGGPARVSNGLAVQPTLHALLDFGAWSLTDDRRVLVSSRFSGSDAATSLLLPLHGRRIRDPIQGHEPVDVSFIRWHREPDLGGIFRGPPLDA